MFRHMQKIYFTLQLQKIAQNEQEMYKWKYFKKWQNEWKLNHISNPQNKRLFYTAGINRA